MFTKKYFNEGLKLSINKLLLNFTTVSAYAEEGKPDSDNNPTNPEPTNGEPILSPTETKQPVQVNFETLIAQARKEEKEKLYPRLQKAEKDLNNQIKANNDLLLQIGTLKAENEQLKGNLNNTELAERIKTLEAENETLKNKEKDIREQVENEYKVKFYAETKKTELCNSGDIISTLLDSITGTTEEEVNAAIEKAKEQTKKIKEELGVTDDNPTNNSGNATVPPQQPQQTGTTSQPQKPPAVNPQVQTGESYDLEYVRNLDPSSPEYKEFRKKLGLK